MFDAFYANFGQNHAGIIGSNLIPMPSPFAPHIHEHNIQHDRSNITAMQHNDTI